MKKKKYISPKSRFVKLDDKNALLQNIVTSQETVHQATATQGLDWGDDEYAI